MNLRSEASKLLSAEDLDINYEFERSVLRSLISEVVI